MSCVTPVSGTATTVQNSLENPDRVLYNALPKIIKFVQESRHDTYSFWGIVRYKKRDLRWRNRIARTANRLPLKGGNLLLSGVVLAIHPLEALGGSKILKLFVI